MGPFFLVLLTLNPQTGDLVKSTVVAPYQSMSVCLHAAIDQGPQKTTDDEAIALVCRLPEEHDFSASRRAPDDVGS